MDRDNQNLSCLRLLFGGLVVPMLAIGLCALVITLTIDLSCAREIEAWLPVYPVGEADILEQEYSLLRRYGMGVTRTTLHIDAPFSMVRRWYQETTRRVAGHYETGGLATTAWRIERAQDNSARVTLITECAQW